jgi:hypothetical protein
MTATTKTDCQATGMCQYDSLIRPRFFDGMLLTDESLLAEQNYHRDALKRVNRYMYGSGILCGFQVEWVSGLCIRVRPGAALDCQGNFIELCRCVTIDLTETCKQCFPGACVPAETPDLVKYLVMRYADKDADPQPVMTSDDPCASSGQTPACQSSKSREGFCFELVDRCPEVDPCNDQIGLLATFFEARDEAAHGGQSSVGTVQMASRAGPATGATSAGHSTAPSPPPAPSAPPTATERLKQPLTMEQSPPCPACECGDKYVGLAKLTINCGKSTVTVDAGCRTYVWTPRLLRTVVCKVFAALDQRLNQGTPATAEARAPNIDLCVREPLEGVRRVLVHFAASEARKASLFQQKAPIQPASATSRRTTPAPTKPASTTPPTPTPPTTTPTPPAASRTPRVRRPTRSPGSGPGGPPPGP